MTTIKTTYNTVSVYLNVQTKFLREIQVSAYFHLLGDENPDTAL